MSDGDLLNQAQLAKHFKVNVSRIQKLAADGRIELVEKKGRSSLYSLSAVKKALAGSLSSGQKSKIKDQLGDIEDEQKPKQDKAETVKAETQNVKQPVTLHQIKVMHEQIKTALSKLDLDIKRGELVKADEVKKTWSTFAASAKIQLLGLTSKIRPHLESKIPYPEDVASTIKIIDQLIDQALTELSGYK